MAYMYGHKKCPIRSRAVNRGWRRWQTSLVFSTAKLRQKIGIAKIPRKKIAESLFRLRKSSKNSINPRINLICVLSGFQIESEFDIIVLISYENLRGISLPSTECTSYYKTYTTG